MINTPLVTGTSAGVLLFESSPKQPVRRVEPIAITAKLNRYFFIFFVFVFLKLIFQ